GRGRVAPGEIRRRVSRHAGKDRQKARVRGPALSERLRAARAGAEGLRRMARENKDLIVALDIGTSKVARLVAELQPDASLEILGMGGHESKGLKKGVVVNIEARVAAIQRALEEAELMADCKIGSAFVGIARSPIRTLHYTR